MTGTAPVTIRMFGSLHTFRTERGLPHTIEFQVPAEGRPAIDIAKDLELPIEKIEAIFCNRIIRELSYIIHPGDRMAFVPTGTPGPHRFLLGIHRAGKKGAG